eukprot:TRINITY_DN13526_c0_g1_i1.p1 TRINITY_DN13526_c0_g1~~TRINITY_DN13526_c0_g1_i1.p1  ORF type:complete len:203 (-),score=25.14 TRINITY_DN13526_c0_g1_i1:69-677(-)
MNSLIFALLLLLPCLVLSTTNWFGIASFTTLGECKQNLTDWNQITFYPCGYCNGAGQVFDCESDGVHWNRECDTDCESCDPMGKVTFYPGECQTSDYFGNSTFVIYNEVPSFSNEYVVVQNFHEEQPKCNQEDIYSFVTYSNECIKIANGKYSLTYCDGSQPTSLTGCDENCENCTSNKNLSTTCQTIYDDTTQVITCGIDL